MKEINKSVLESPKSSAHQKNYYYALAESDPSKFLVLLEETFNECQSDPNLIEKLDLLQNIKQELRNRNIRNLKDGINKVIARVYQTAYEELKPFLFEDLFAELPELVDSIYQETFNSNKAIRDGFAEIVWPLCELKSLGMKKEKLISCLGEFYPKTKVLFEKHTKVKNEPKVLQTSLTNKITKLFKSLIW